MLLNKEYMYL
uniref:Uncharacterized protein n=1 Tax=Moniliophthora roreri TaxID=221103 RepID=A0A0W0F7P9_MONRR